MPHFNEDGRQPSIDEQIQRSLEVIMLDPERAMESENLPRGEAPLALFNGDGRRLAELKTIAYREVRRLVMIRIFGQVGWGDENFNYIFTPCDSTTGEVTYFAYRQPLEGKDPKERLKDHLQYLEQFAPRLFPIDDDN